MDINNHNLGWLMENGSPAIRIRTWKEVLGNEPTQKMINDLLDFSMTQQWMERLQPNPHFMNMHGSKPEHFENLCGKLRELGFTVGMSPEWTAKLQPYIDYLSKEKAEHGLNELSLIISFAPLVTIGYEYPLLIDTAIDHLKKIGEFCSQMNYDIHIDPDTFGGMYKAYEGRKLLNPEYNNLLPTIWDIYMLAYMPRNHREKEIQQAENAIINYILTDQYQHLPHGYGIMYHSPTKKYYAYGWNIGLPGWLDFSEIGEKPPVHFVQRLELMANFRQAHTRKWLQNCLRFLESFQTESGTYRFPSTFLKEGSGGYYVFGNYLRLEENRRRKIALELDSTFRMELIKKRISQ